MSDEQATSAADELGEIQQIPASVIRVTQPATVTDARDQLLAAIGSEAQHLVDTQAGQAAAALESLARAYALIATSTTTTAADAATAQAMPAARSSNDYWKIEVWDHDHIGNDQLTGAPIVDIR